MSIIYDSIFLPMVTYTCGTWEWAARKVHTKRKLISSQRRALLLITKCYRTVSNRCLQALARKPPIDLEIFQREKYQQIKWGSNITVSNNTIQPEDIEWTIPYSETLFPIGHTANTEENTNNNYIDIYTDGSKINNSVGCSLVVYENSLETTHLTFRLDDRCTVFQAELYAIWKAVETIDKSHNNISVTINTDSLSAYKIIKSTKLHPLAENIRNQIRLSNCKFQLTWVKAHQGVVGNERADSLAKSATTLDKKHIVYKKISRRSLRSLLWEETLQLWQTTWDLDKDHITYKFIPDIQQHLRNKWYSPNFYANQIFTNHGKFANYLARFVNYTSDVCNACDVRDGPDHYLFNCIAFERERLEFKILLETYKISWPFNHHDIWINKDIYHNFIQFAKRIYTVNKSSLHS
ncbi:uncharacterized protein LOC111628381 [Centruroides sculpturatus]|uniref:uncharacterized protein LOC111628381 n=1 Tax=Centruroides sculpturatus TaxID=218467 RepID=UPI000C6D3288|nr:uncharacterized protein LOC111628381 [Centruroides sculpturatus]